MPAETETKLVIIRKQLEANPDVYLSGTARKTDSLTYMATPLANVNGGTVRIDRVRFHTAPYTPTFDPQQLNDFMRGLLPGIKLAGQDVFHEARMGGGVNAATLFLGWWHFIEPLGIKTVDIKSQLQLNSPLKAAPDELKALGVKLPEDLEVEKASKTTLILNREISVLVFPNKEYANNAYAYHRHLWDSSQPEVKLLPEFGMGTDSICLYPIYNPRNYLEQETTAIRRGRGRPRRV